MPKPEPTILCPTGADLDRLDPDAVRATQRLTSRGYEAFLVGGCVRDLLLGRAAKDYDIATSARPQQVKRTFPRNCRIIGRRFKLAHLHFDRNTKILEVSTFRRTPEDDGGDDLLITRDNEFGTAEEDALRRDFTINALFLDPTEDKILDWCDGLADLEDRVIRTIGDPRVRFREDPVRILRAAKFAGRLGFSIEPETFAAMAETAGDLVRAAPPRVLEEILRLLRGGHALPSFQLLRDVGALKSLVPVLAEFLATADRDQRDAFWGLLEALDERVLGGDVPSNAVLLGVLLVGPVLAMAEAEPDRSPSSIAEELLGPLGQELKLPRRDAGCLKRICGVQHRFVQGEGKKRFRVGGFVRGPYYDEAIELFELRVAAGQVEGDALDRWHELVDRRIGAADRGGAAGAREHDDDDREDAADGDEIAPAERARDARTEASDTTEGPRRKKRRRRRRRSSGSYDDAADVVFGEPARAAADDDDNDDDDVGAEDDAGDSDDDGDRGYREDRARGRSFADLDDPADDERDREDDGDGEAERDDDRDEEVIGFGRPRRPARSRGHDDEADADDRDDDQLRPFDSEPFDETLEGEDAGERDEPREGPRRRRRRRRRHRGQDDADSEQGRDEGAESPEATRFDDDRGFEDDAEDADDDRDRADDVDRDEADEAEREAEVGERDEGDEGDSEQRSRRRRRRRGRRRSGGREPGDGNTEARQQPQQPRRQQQPQQQPKKDRNDGGGRRNKRRDRRRSGGSRDVD
ncbi:MAG: polynucleotide adenylyltransferase PcnB, partial [Planctomycetes bacterium]|nr:polynucleotide adenylyltransferase PcnB [Planctomycetota bacterium]